MQILNEFLEYELLPQLNRSYFDDAAVDAWTQDIIAAQDRGTKLELSSRYTKSGRPELLDVSEVITDSLINAIAEHCNDHDIEIVSYGLAPNPNGFCYERGEETSKTDCLKLDKLLGRLDKDQTLILKKYIFG